MEREYHESLPAIYGFYLWWSPRLAVRSSLLHSIIVTTTSIGDMDITYLDKVANPPRCQ